MRQSAMVVVVTFGLACGGAPAPDGSGGSAGTGGDAAGGSGPSGGAPAAGGTSSSGGSVATGGDDGAGGTGGTAGVVPSDLFPLALGNSWTWVVINEATADTCDENYLVEELYEADTVGGRDALIISSACAPPDLEQDARMAVVDQEVTQWIDEQWQVTLSAPVGGDHTWTIVSSGAPGDYRWVATGEVTVPAGTFQNCWTRQLLPEEPTSIRTYCPGVGPVREEYPALTLELASYHLE